MSSRSGILLQTLLDRQKAILYASSHVLSLTKIRYSLSYQGYDDNCSLTYGLDLNSSAIVLLDEIEKAHPDVLSVFLQIFDEGLISNSKVSELISLHVA